METISPSINRNDETIIQTLLLMGFKNTVSAFDNGDASEYSMDFGPELEAKMTFWKGFHSVQKCVRYWSLSIKNKSGTLITKITYNMDHTEQDIISDLVYRMLRQTEFVSEQLLKDKLKTLIL